MALMLKETNNNYLRNTMKTTISSIKKNIDVSKYLVFAITILMLLFFVSCKPYFLVADFDTRTSNHKSVAILPFEMVFTGVKPDRLTDDDLQIIGEAESKAFMISFYNEVLRSTRGGRKPIRVNVQHFDKTLNILKTNNIDIRSSWKEDSGKLAKMLGVDAVVKTRVEKYRLMSDLTSYGVELGVRILAILSDYKIYPWLPPNLTKSKEIKSSCSLLDAEGVTLWSIAYDFDADWRSPSNEIIDNINRKSAKQFPYRMKK